MFWRFYQLVSAKVPHCSFVSKSICRITRPVFYLVICLLRSLMEEQIAEARSMGLTANSLPEASLGDVGAGKFQLLFSSVFSCAVSVSLEFSVIFLLSKYTDCPNCRYSLRRDCKRDLKNFRHVRWKCQSFSKLANTTSRQSFLLEGLNRFSLDKYPSF